MKRVLIIYTGGTIGMTRTENGYAPRAGYFRAALDAIPDLRAPEMPEWEFYELSPLLDSSNMTVREWNCIAELIAQKYDDYDGFVVLHGTDTMAYTASALSFMLDGLDKPVVLTGSQIPLCEIRSDGRDNLITALLIAGEGIVRETCLYFGGKLLRGNRATKYSADGLIAFVSPNYPSLAEAGISIKYNEAALLPRQEGGLKLQTLDNIPIGVIKVFPGIQFSLFEAIMTEKLRGIVIETFGAGNIPGDGNALLPIIRKAFQNGTVLTVCSQCPQGAVSLGTYETSSALKKAGAVSGLDMTTEAAVAKLYYLLSLLLRLRQGEDQAGNGRRPPRRDQRFLSASSASFVSTSQSSVSGASKSSRSSKCLLMTALPPTSPSSDKSSGKKRAGKRQGLPRTPLCPNPTMFSLCARKNSSSCATVLRLSIGWSATMKQSASQSDSAAVPRRIVSLWPRSGCSFRRASKPNFLAAASTFSCCVTTSTREKLSRGIASSACSISGFPFTIAASLFSPKRAALPAAMTTHPIFNVLSI